MKHIMLITCLLLAGCGSTKTTHFERATASALLGLVVFAPIGVPIYGAIIVGGVGTFADGDDINIGEPVWRWWDD